MTNDEAIRILNDGVNTMASEIMCEMEGRSE